MLKFATLLGLVALSYSSPLPQAIEKDAEVIPAIDLPEGTSNRREGIPTIIVRRIPARDVFNLGSLFGGSSSPFDIFSDSPFGSRRRIVPVVPDTEPDSVGSPDFVSVPAEGSKTQNSPKDTSISTVEGGPLTDYFQNFRDLQKQIFSTFLDSGIFDLADPTDPGPVDSPTDVDPFQGFQGGSGIFGGFDGFPSFGDLPPDYENSTTREEVINGQKVKIDETIKRRKTPFGTSVVHLKVYRVNPDGTVSEQDPTRPDEPQPTDVPQTPLDTEQKPAEPVEKPAQKTEETGKDQEEEFPAVTFNEPEEGPILPQQTEDFGTIVDPGLGVEEQIPDASLNEIP